MKFFSIDGTAVISVETEEDAVPVLSSERSELVISPGWSVGPLIDWIMRREEGRKLKSGLPDFNFL